MHTLLPLLAARFAQYPHRHPHMAWNDVQAKLQAHPEKLRSLREMEATGGEPDVIGYDADTNEYIFCDCSPESPAGRRSVCYDRQALDARKEHKPKAAAVEMAEEMGIELLTEEQYGALQKIEAFDQKTSSWLLTPPEIRELGGALFANYHYGRVFVYYNGAQSYYAARGFRGMLRV